MSKVYFKGCTFWAQFKDSFESWYVNEGYSRPEILAEYIKALSITRGPIINCGVIPPYVTEEEK